MLFNYNNFAFPKLSRDFVVTMKTLEGRHSEGVPVEGKSPRLNYAQTHPDFYEILVRVAFWCGRSPVVLGVWLSQ